MRFVIIFGSIIYSFYFSDLMAGLPAWCIEALQQAANDGPGNGYVKRSDIERILMSERAIQEGIDQITYGSAYTCPYCDEIGFTHDNDSNEGRCFGCGKSWDSSIPVGDITVNGEPVTHIRAFRLNLNGQAQDFAAPLRCESCNETTDYRKSNCEHCGDTLAQSKPQAAIFEGHRAAEFVDHNGQGIDLVPNRGRSSPSFVADYGPREKPNWKTKILLTGIFGVATLTPFAYRYVNRNSPPRVVSYVEESAEIARKWMRRDVVIRVRNEDTGAMEVEAILRSPRDTAELQEWPETDEYHNRPGKRSFQFEETYIIEVATGLFAEEKYAIEVSAEEYESFKIGLKGSLYLNQTGEPVHFYGDER